jgi:glycosyltransferase domain-containing protein
MIRDLTIVIPTYNNRHEYLKRSIYYHYEFGVQIQIADSSSKPFNDLDFKNFPNIKYFHLSGLSLTKKLDFILQKISTPYTLLLPDDDFITKEGIITCLKFLQENNDYASAQGNQIHFKLNKGKIFAYPIMTHLVGYEILDSSPSERIKKLFEKHIYFNYSVNRTENIALTYSLTSNFSDEFIIGMIEYFFNIITIINGKHKVLPVFYSAREYSEYSSINLYLTPFQLKVSQEYKEQYIECLGLLSKYLSNKEGCSMDEANEIIDYAFHQSPYFVEISKTSPHISERVIYPLYTFPILKRIIDAIPMASFLKGKYIKLVQAKFRYRSKSLLKKLIRDVKEKKLPAYPFSDSRALKEWLKIKSVLKSKI